MSRHSDLIRLRHMADYASEALEMVAGRTRRDLCTDRMLNLSLVRLLEMVGEAASRLSAATIDAYPDIPWPQIIAFRNRLIHGYDEVDFDILWDIVKGDLPPLIEMLKRILSSGHVL